MLRPEQVIDIDTRIAEMELQFALGNTAVIKAEEESGPEEIEEMNKEIRRRRQLHTANPSDLDDEIPLGPMPKLVPPAIPYPRPRMDVPGDPAPWNNPPPPPKPWEVL